MAAGEARILAVEDDMRNVALLHAVLEPAGYRLSVVNSLAEARAWLADERPDLVLLDVGLPDGNGLDLARELRANERTADLPMLVSSARVMAGDEQAARQAGADVFLAKPVLPRTLIDAVSRSLAALDEGHEPPPPG